MILRRGIEIRSFQKKSKNLQSVDKTGPCRDGIYVHIKNLALNRYTVHENSNNGRLFVGGDSECESRVADSLTLQNYCSTSTKQYANTTVFRSHATQHSEGNHHHEKNIMIKNSM